MEELQKEHEDFLNGKTYATNISAPGEEPTAMRRGEESLVSLLSTEETQDKELATVPVLDKADDMVLLVGQCTCAGGTEFDFCFGRR
jgi:hypothetical protein